MSIESIQFAVRKVSWCCWNRDAVKCHWSVFWVGSVSLSEIKYSESFIYREECTFHNYLRESKRDDLQILLYNISLRFISKCIVKNLQKYQYIANILLKFF